MSDVKFGRVMISGVEHVSAYSRARHERIYLDADDQRRLTEFLKEEPLAQKRAERLAELLGTEAEKDEKDHFVNLPGEHLWVVFFDSSSEPKVNPTSKCSEPLPFGVMSQLTEHIRQVMEELPGVFDSH